MSLLDREGGAEFPFSKDVVFDAMIKAIPTVKGMKISSSDKLSGRITVKTGVTIASFGENVPIQLISVAENKTQVKISSAPKIATFASAALDMGKNNANIERILTATSAILSSQGNNVSSSNSVSNNSISSMEALPKKKKMSIGKKILIGIGIFMLIGALCSLGDDESGNSSSNGTSGCDWEMSEKVDEMSGNVNNFAEVYSTNELDFDFPYDGGSSFALILRHMDGNNSICLFSNNAQFDINYDSTDKVQIRIDDKPAVWYSFSESQSDEPGLIFINNTAQLIEELKTGKKLKIQASFFEEGRKIIKFDIEGLVWNF